WKTLSPSETIQWDSTALSWTRFATPNDWELSDFYNNGNKFYWFRFTVTESSNINISSIWLEFPNPFDGFPGILTVTSSGNNYYYDSTANPFGSLTLKIGASSSGHALANQYGPNWNQTNFQMGYFSSAGPKSNGVPGVDVVAPGFYVYSVAPLARSLQGGDSGPGDFTEYGGDGTYSFVRWAGTSASTPAAAGVAAIAYQAYMNEHQGEYVNPNTIKQILKSTATNLYYPSNIQGTGLINASSAVEFIQNPDTSKYFLTGSNITFEDQLKSSGWLATLGDFFWYYVYSNRDPYANLIDFPVTLESLLSYPHYDVDLSTKSVTKGDIVTTQVAIMNNGTGEVGVSAHNANMTDFDSNTVVIDNNDVFLGMTGDYQINISIAELNGWNSDFIEIKVENLDVIDNATFFVWQDFDGDGHLEMANYTMPETNGKGELARVQYASTRENRTFGILKVGNPARFNTSTQIPFIVLRGNPNLVDVYSSNWASGMIFEVSMRSYDLYSDWSSVVTTSPWKTENGVSVWNVSLDTNGSQAGFHFGYLNFTDLSTGHTQWMPISLKVAYGEIDQSDPTTNVEANPTLIGDYTLSRAGEKSEITFRDGSMVWVPFTVDESKTNGEQVLVIRVTQLSAGDANFGYVLHYDETPNSFDSSWFPILVSPNITGQIQGKNVNWQYIPWESVGFGSDTFISRFGYFRFGFNADPPVVRYKLGLFSNEMEDELDVRLEMYWLPRMPALDARITGNAPFFEYCQVSESNLCFYGTQIFYGPDAELNITTLCNFCDPNLPTPSVLFDKVDPFTEITTGSFDYGFNPDISIDWWEKRKFEAGDLVEFTVGPTEPVTDFNLWLFTPSTLELFNLTRLGSLPLNDTGLIFQSDFFFDFATELIGETGSFVAEESGEYWFGIDNYGFASTDWIVFTRVSRGQITNYQTSSIVINTHTDPEFGLDVEATYDSLTDTYDKVTSLVVGAHTPTNLGSGLYSSDINIDNLVAPFAFLGESSTSLNGTEINRELGSVIIDWEGVDLNGDNAVFLVVQVGPNPDEVYANIFNSNSASWDFSDENIYSDGWWTFFIWVDDSVDPSNIIDGKNYGGTGIPATFRVFLHTSTTIKTTVTELGNETIGPNLLEMLGFTALGAIGGVAVISLGAVTYLRRVEIGNKMSDVRVKVKEQLEKRRSREE
ncbi:MAG: S8 family serine peptidase, partial [Candidatus Hodarchaeales archaeon]